MTDERRDRQFRTLIALAGLIAALLALLVGGLGLGVWVAVTEGKRLEALLARQAEDLDRRVDQVRATSNEAAHEVASRQEATNAALSRQSRATLEQIHVLQARRRALTAIPADPLGKVDLSIRLAQLTTDEQLLLLTHIAETQAAVAPLAKPLPVQKKLEKR